MLVLPTPSLLAKHENKLILYLFLLSDVVKNFQLGFIYSVHPDHPYLEQSTFIKASCNSAPIAQTDDYADTTYWLLP